MARAALDCWLRQDWPNKELVVVDDIDSPSFPGGLMMDRVDYRSIRREGMTLGAKRNIACSFARGEIVCHFDDDDWSAPDRVRFQVDLLKRSGKPVTGFMNLYFWDTLKSQAKLYRSTVSGYVCGTSLMFLRSFWEGYRFRNKQQASDNDFVYPILKLIAASGDPTHMVARIHGAHTSNKCNISQVVPKEFIPAGFWENEKLRLA